MYSLLLVVGIFSACVSAGGISDNPDDVKFYQYTESTRMEIEYNNLNSAISAGFRSNKNTVFIIDGFLSDETSPMSQTMKEGFLLRGGSAEHNIIIVDWGRLSGHGTPLTDLISTGLTYIRVLNNVGRVAERVADFIQFLDLPGSQVHIVGHSLGAHIAGSAGVFSRNKYGRVLNRLSGLDPAGPVFSSQLDADKRLYKTDATFVDIYHTNRGTLGDSSVQTGDINVFINGGANQPGCEAADAEGFQGFCSHSFSWQFFAATFMNTLRGCPCSGVACQCKDCVYTCDNPISLGLSAPFSSTGAYHIKTTAVQP